MADGTMKMSDEFYEDMYDLFGYMTSAAKELVNDPQIYAPFRMVDSVTRIITIMESQGVEEEFFTELKDYINENKFSMVDDEEAFISFLNELVLKVARKTEQI